MNFSLNSGGWWRRGDSNPLPQRCERCALPDELRPPKTNEPLHRMERQKLLAAEWQEAEGRRRKYYRLTAQGKKSLAEKKAEWEKFAKGVQGVLGLTYGWA